MKDLLQDNNYNWNSNIKDYETLKKHNNTNTINETNKYIQPVTTKDIKKTRRNI